MSVPACHHEEIQRDATKCQYCWISIQNCEKEEVALPKSKMMTFGRLQETVAAILDISLSLIKAISKVLCIRLNGSTARITDLPPEILVKILSFVPTEDHPSVSRVSKAFHEACENDYIWRRRSSQDYKALCSGGFRWKDIYIKILHKYGNLIGYWQAETLSYGGLLEVKYDNGKILGTFLFPTLGWNIKRPLMRQKRFEIVLNNNNEAEIHCLSSSQCYHKGKVNWFGKRKFFTRCEDASSCFKRFSASYVMDSPDEREFERLLKDEVEINDHNREMLEYKYFTIFNHKHTCFYFHLPMPKKCANVPIQPGLFTGTYGAHGVELIMLDYIEDNNVATAVKITGDPNVPACKISFASRLNYSMTLALGEQMSVSYLESLEVLESPYDSTKMRPHSFKVPLECTRPSMDIPETCIARFLASGQVAGHEFTNSSYITGHWIIFNEDLFAFLWLDLLSLSMFHRVKEFTLGT